MKFLLLLMLISCQPKEMPSLNSRIGLKTICIEGIKYYFTRGHGLTIALDKKSKVKPCEKDLK